MAEGEVTAAGAMGGFEDFALVAHLSEFVGGGETADARAKDEHLALGPLKGLKVGEGHGPGRRHETESAGGAVDRRGPPGSPDQLEKASP